MLFGAGDKCIKASWINHPRLIKIDLFFCRGQKLYENGIVGYMLSTGDIFAFQGKVLTWNAYKSFWQIVHCCVKF
jgi:hypothetical protein